MARCHSGFLLGSSPGTRRPRRPLDSALRWTQTVTRKAWEKVIAKPDLSRESAHRAMMIHGSVSGALMASTCQTLLRVRAPPDSDLARHAQGWPAHRLVLVLRTPSVYVRRNESSAQGGSPAAGSEGQALLTGSLQRAGCCQGGGASSNGTLGDAMQGM